MARKYTFHKENCSSQVRTVIQTVTGHIITLMGKHAYEWEIVIEQDNKVVITTFPNRISAVKEFKKYK